MLLSLTPGPDTGKRVRVALLFSLCVEFLFLKIHAPASLLNSKMIVRHGAMSCMSILRRLGMGALKNSPCPSIQEGGHQIVSGTKGSPQSKCFLYIYE